jgi:hypothetical protein
VRERKRKRERERGRERESARERGGCHAGSPVISPKFGVFSGSRKATMATRALVSLGK